MIRSSAINGKLRYVHSPSVLKTPMAMPKQPRLHAQIDPKTPNYLDPQASHCPLKAFIGALQRTY
jgi:hypothetical protein